MKKPVNNLSKRKLRTPADYSGDVTSFLLSEYLSAEWLFIGDAQDPKGSTGWARQLINQRYDAAVSGLYGCTSVVVVSRSAMWISHFWEIPSFRAKTENWLQPRVQEDIDNFNDQVIEQMQNGGPDIVGLTQFTAPGGQFHSLQNPVWAIVTPRADNGVASTYRYAPEVDAIMGVLGNLFPNAPPVVVDYVTNSDPVAQATTATGKILFQYDPFEAIITDPNDSCKIFQQAIFRLWVEDRPTWVWQKYWPAEPQQFITDFSNYQPHKHKRDVSACEIPSSLPQAAIETSGPNLVFSSEPDPEATYWITLSNEVGSTTEASSKSQTSSSLFPLSSTSGSTTGTSTPSTTLASSASTATPNCLADGAPWFSPTRSVSLRKNWGILLADTSCVVSVTVALPRTQLCLQQAVRQVPIVPTRSSPHLQSRQFRRLLHPRISLVWGVCPDALRCYMVTAKTVHMQIVSHILCYIINP